MITGVVPHVIRTKAAHISGGFWALSAGFAGGIGSLGSGGFPRGGPFPGIQGDRVLTGVRGGGTPGAPVADRN